MWRITSNALLKKEEKVLGGDPCDQEKAACGNMIDEARVNALCEQLEQLGKRSMIPDEVEATLKELHSLLGPQAYGKIRDLRKLLSNVRIKDVSAGKVEVYRNTTALSRMAHIMNLGVYCAGMED
jgi:ribosomal protein S12 methylthiotransferase accessory factor YcaO